VTQAVGTEIGGPKEERFINGAATAQVKEI
jgi:hypothetical protein